MRTSLSTRYFATLSGAVLVAGLACVQASPSPSSGTADSSTLRILSPDRDPIPVVQGRTIELQGQGDVGRVVSATGIDGAFLADLGRAPVDGSRAWRLSVTLPMSGLWQMVVRYEDELWNESGTLTIHVDDEQFPAQTPWWLHNDLGITLTDLRSALSEEGFLTSELVDPISGEARISLHAWTDDVTQATVVALGDPAKGIWIKLQSRCSETCAFEQSDVVHFLRDGPNPFSVLDSLGVFTPDDVAWIGEVLRAHYVGQSVLVESKQRYVGGGLAQVEAVPFPFPAFEITAR